MGHFRAFGQQKHSPSVVSPSSFAQPVRPFVPMLTPVLQPASLAGDAQSEHARRFGHSLNRLSILPPDQYPVMPDHHGPSIIPPMQQNHSVQEGSPSPMESYSSAGAHARNGSPSGKNTTGMPDALKAGVESLSGLSFDDVHVHYNSPQPAQVQALAYTQGTEIHLGPGQEQHLAHEAWHVVQQKQGRVKPTLQIEGMAVNDDKGLEREADVMESRAAARRPLEGRPATFVETASRVQTRTPLPTGRSPIQRQIILDNSLKDNGDIQELRQSPLYKSLDGWSDRIYIKQSDAPSDTMVRTDFNRRTFKEALPQQLKKANIRYIINLKTDTVAAGLPLDKSRYMKRFAARPPKPSEAKPILSEQPKKLSYSGGTFSGSYPPDLEQVLSELQTKAMIKEQLKQGIVPDLPPGVWAMMEEPQRRGVLVDPYQPPLHGNLANLPWQNVEDVPKMEPIGLGAYLGRLLGEGPEPRSHSQLSLYTVLLHELGHIQQHRRTQRIFTTGQKVKDIKETTIPPIPGKLLERTMAALDGKELDNPVWREIVDMKNSMQRWLPVIRDYFQGKGRENLYKAAKEAIDIEDQIAYHAQVWLEYDVITNVEHPEALKRGEAIRHLHGAEMAVNPEQLGRNPSVPQQEQTMKSLSEKNVALNPGNLKDLQEMMKKNAFELTRGLPILLKSYLQSIGALVEAAKQIKEED